MYFATALLDNSEIVFILVQPFSGKNVNLNPVI